MSEKRHPEKMEAASLTEADWNFDNVPDGELVACCCWEYARESAFIRQVCEKYRAVKPRFRTLFGSPSEIPANKYGSVFTEGWPPDDNGLAWPFAGGFPRPWQQLDKAERAFRSALAGMRPLHYPIQRDPLWVLHALERHAADRLKSAKQLGQTEQMASAFKPSVIWRAGRESAVMRIAWGEFTNDELVQYFRRWVKDNRPKDIPEPDRRGKKLKDWRVALARLGVLRALYGHTFADFRFPKPLKERGEKSCYAARKAALAKFQCLFPFLPKGHKPIHWPTKGGRSS